ncbi:MAG: hypothetical protein MAG451_00920 [Anaerolineales bacterium]|nr:hypothetical protein [Anaerolineales bacterium]
MFENQEIEREREQPMTLGRLAPAPLETWDRLQRFLAISDEEIAAMQATVDVLFRRGPQLVADTYDYLLHFEETAAILGWESGADPEHLEERRRFFTIWLARTIGMDMGHDFAQYLFWAGKKHAGHGPRQTHVDTMYVTGAISLVQSAFADFIAAEIDDAARVALALAGWNKYLTLQLQLMLDGYHAARAIEDGQYPIEVALFGRLRPLLEVQRISIWVQNMAPAGELLRKFFNYFPEARAEALEREWDTRSPNGDATWLAELEHVYRPRRGWRVLLNGKNLRFHGGLEAPLDEGDQVSIFPPGR